MKSIVPAALAALTLLTEPARADTPMPVVVPFELLASKHIAVKVKINGKGPYRLIFDTGAPFSIVNNKTARASGMLANQGAAWFSLFASQGAVKVKTLEIGMEKVSDTDAAVMDHPTVGVIARALGPIEGLIGFPFFARYRLTIDYQAKQLTLTPSGYAAPGTEAVLEELVESMTTDRKRVLAPAAQWGFVPHKAAGDEEAGVTVKAVLPRSAAAAAGLKAGDRLLTLDGRWTDSVADTYHAAGHVKPGTTANVVVRRGGKELTLAVTPRAGL